MVRSRFFLRGAFLVLLLMSLAACGGGSDPERKVTIGIGLKVSPSENILNQTSFASSLSSVAQVKIHVSDPGGTFLASASMQVEGVSPGETVSLELQVSPGPSRLFRAEALDASGKILFEGEASADLLLGVSAVLTLQMKPVPIVALTPITATVGAGETLVFTSSVTGLEEPSIIWSVNETEGGNTIVGTISPIGEGLQAVYRAPSIPPAPPMVTIKAATKARPDRFSATTVTILLPSQGIFIDQARGSNQPDCGTETAPCKTLTQGMGKATGGRVLVVAPGTYHFGNPPDEPLPFLMKPGVILQGSGTDKTILELNHIASPNLPAIIGAEEATLTRFTIKINECPESVLLLKDLSSTIRDNTFLGSSQRCATAIRVTGNGSPLIVGNRFGGDGHHFDIGLSLEEEASPSVLKNFFAGNQIGIRTTHHVTARIEENVIIRNGTGVMIEDDATPDLGGGMQRSGGGNILSCNSNADLQLLGRTARIFAENNAWDHLPPIGGGRYHWKKRERELRSPEGRTRSLQHSSDHDHSCGA